MEMTGVDTDKSPGGKSAAVATEAEQAVAEVSTAEELESEGALSFTMQTSPSVVTCAQLCAFLDDYLADALPDNQRRAFDQHLGQSNSCRLYVENYKQTTHLRKEEFCDAHLSDCKEMSEALINAILSTKNLGEEN